MTSAPVQIAEEVAASATSAQVSVPPTPYKGLSYYSEEDAPFFFGRESETQVIIANLMASRLTLVYGQSGVGKSSLLRAGAARQLRETAIDNIARRGTAQFVTVVFPAEDGSSGDSWRDDPVTALAGAIERAVDSLGMTVETPPRDLPLDELLEAWTKLLQSDLLIILDQFEEYLLYHGNEDGRGTLAHDLPRALARPNLRASFLISIREDALARLDRFKGRIPTLFENYLRVHHLDQKGARAAILGPIETYNELVEADPEFAVEPELVDALLKELETGRVVVGVVGVGVSDPQSRGSDAERRIETPFLQLVMTRLWKEELAANSRVLRLSTLERLGHSEKIVKTHLDGAMKNLPRYARWVAALVFHHLVTPSGTKIAHTAADLAAYVELGTTDVEPVLDALTGSEYRILRRVSAAEGDTAPTSYEIFHDVLAAAILDWRARYLRTRAVAQSLRRGATTIFNLAIGVGWIVFAVRTSLDDHKAPDEVFVVWGICAVLVWARTTLLLARRSRQRTAWLIPFVGIVASALGPITVAVTAALAATRGWAGLVRGKPREVTPDPVAGGHKRGRIRTRLAEDRVRTFSVIVAVVGATVLLAACFLPLYADDVSLVTNSVWLALVPLVTVGAIVLLAWLLLLRPPSRRWTSGFLAGLGIGGLTFFIAWGGLGTQFGGLQGAGLGPFFGVVGAGLVAVAAAPTSSLAVLAALVGADQYVGDAQGGETAQPVGSRRRKQKSKPLWREPLRTFPVLAALAGAALVAVASFSSSFQDSYEDQSGSLYGESQWLVVQPLAIATAATLVGLILLGGPTRRQFAWGLLAGLGITSLTLFGGYVGLFATDSDYAPRYGLYLGCAGSALLALAVLGSRRSPAVGTTQHATAPEMRQ